MKTPAGCKLIGAHQALSGIGETVVLFHSVVGCNFGTLGLHLPNDMVNIRQSCTIISDEDIIFGGEELLEKAIDTAAELYHPKAIFIISGCVSELTGDDITGVIRRKKTEVPVFHMPAAGFSGGFSEGYEQGLLLLEKLMPEPRQKKDKPSVNLLGFGADDYRAKRDAAAVRELLCGAAEVRCAIGCCTREELSIAPDAHLNLVFGRGEQLARAMRDRFGIPYEIIDYPYGATGAEQIWDRVGRFFDISFDNRGEEFREGIAGNLKPVYAYLQALYGMPAAVIGEGGRARGLRRFLECELGMAVTAFAVREGLDDVDSFYAAAENSEAALLFGSSFEQELSDKLGVPLIRYDYPVFDEICVTDSPLIGEAGTVRLVEEIINTVMRGRNLKGALYQ